MINDVDYLQLALCCYCVPHMLTKIDAAKIAPATPAPTLANLTDVKSDAAKATDVDVE